MRKDEFDINKFIASSDFRYKLKEWGKLEQSIQKHTSEVVTRKMTPEERKRYGLDK